MESKLVLDVINLLYKYSYLILFPLVIIEGPVVTLIAGILASFNFLNLFIAYVVVVLGDLGGDVIYYFAGRYWFRSTFDKTMNFFKISKSKIEKTEAQLKKNRAKVLIFGKLSHVIGVFILFIAGHAEIPFWEYVWFNFLATLPKSLILILVGYFFGSTITNYNKTLNYTFLGLVILTVFLILVLNFISSISANIVKKDNIKN